MKHKNWQPHTLLDSKQGGRDQSNTTQENQGVGFKAAWLHSQTKLYSFIESLYIHISKLKYCQSVPSI